MGSSWTTNKSKQVVLSELCGWRVKDSPPQVISHNNIVGSGSDELQLSNSESVVLVQDMPSPTGTSRKCESGFATEINAIAVKLISHRTVLHGNHPAVPLGFSGAESSLMVSLLLPWP